MKNLRIVFMGTPEFAVGILDAILKNNYNVVGVITASDKPAGRGQKIKYSAIKEYALAQNLNLLQPTNLKDENFLTDLKKLEADVQVVVAFRMLPEAVWSMAKYGTFNLHASLLPNYRGAAPINWAIINGEEKTGVTTFFIDNKIDTGAIILSNTINIEATENAGQLHDKLLDIGSTTVLDTLNLIANGIVKTIAQKENVLQKNAPKLTKENCKIDFNRSGTDIYNLIRGLSPYPAAWCEFSDDKLEHLLKIYDAKFTPAEHKYVIGAVLCTKKELKVAISDGFLEILTLQIAGKKKMTTIELLNGFQFSDKTKIKIL